MIADAMHRNADKAEVTATVPGSAAAEEKTEGKK